MHRNFSADLALASRRIQIDAGLKHPQHVIGQKVALLQSKRLYSSQTTTADETAEDYRIGFENAVACRIRVGRRAVQAEDHTVNPVESRRAKVAAP